MAPDRVALLGKLEGAATSREAAKLSVISLVAGALALGGCATTESVQHAQATADQAMSTAQAAGAAAQRAQSSADAAASAAQAAGAAAQRAQSTADAAASAAQAASSDARSANDRVGALEAKMAEHVATHHRRRHRARN